jgi:HEAT repeat protein
MSAAASQAADVRAAALSALGALGDGSSVILLAEAAAGEGPGQGAARLSLYGLRGPEIDPAIAAAIKSTSGGVRAELIVAAVERGAAAAADALVRAAREPDPDVRREALRALRNVASPAHIPALLDLLAAASTAQDRREATQALASLVRRSQPGTSQAVISAYEAASSLEARLSLLEVVGQSSGPGSLSLLRRSLKDPSPEIVRAAILALSGWADPAPLADLLAVAREGVDPAHRILALRGYLKLVALPSRRPAPETARLLENGMRLATQPAEKRAALALLAAHPCRESLAVAKSWLGDDAVAKEASAAVNQIENALKRMRDVASEKN